MKYSEIESFIDDCVAIRSQELRWCDQHWYSAENMPGAAPGGYLNPFGYFVVATTFGGNAIIINPDAQPIWFADHTWYNDSGISYQDLAGDNKWHDIPMSADGITRSLFALSFDRSTFMESLRSGDMDRLIDKID